MGKHNMGKGISFLLIAGLLAATTLLPGCGTLHQSFNPEKKYAKGQLQEDYRLFREILEDAHPSLYWYESKDSLDYFFDTGYQLIHDSMTEPQFRTLLSYVISRVHCGHTSVRFSKSYAKYIDTARQPQFPLGIKFWADSAVVYTNVNRKDSVLTRGTIITAIDGRSISAIRDSLFRYMVTDGYSLSHKYQTLSNIGTFGGLYQAVFGARDSFDVSYLDGTAEKTRSIRLFSFASDTTFRNYLKSLPRPGRKQRKRNDLFSVRNIQVDTMGSTAYMTVSTFSNGNKLQSFFRNSFRELQRAHIRNLVIDLRFNGGGNVSLSTKLTRYLIDHKFKLADSLYASRRLSRYEGHIQNSCGAFFIMHFMTHKERDGHYHFGYFERHYFSPKEKYHYGGQVYVLTGGNSFSASTLFVNAVKGQSNIHIAGEETGGGSYGNTAWFIPDATLPNTKVRFRLPRFRMVMNKNYPKNGRGIFPDTLILPSSIAIKAGIDPKVEYVKKQVAASAGALH
jgi:hypothetical protein